MNGKNREVAGSYGDYEGRISLLAQGWGTKRDILIIVNIYYYLTPYFD